MTMEKKLLLSIICATYNHEKYLKFALDGILMQKTNFQYEVLIGEDCSTDESKRILKEYEHKYPGYFTIFYREKNYGIDQNFNDLYKKAHGKYVIVLETDDFWIDPYKLQKEVDFLEDHPEFIAVSHRCIMVNEENRPLGIQYPECHAREYTFRHFRKSLLPGQTTTLMYRNIHNDNSEGKFQLIDDKKYSVGAGDRRKVFALLANGKIACLPDVMSVYRYITEKGSSYSANVREDYKGKLYYRKLFIDYAVENSLSNECIYTAEYMYIRDACMVILKKGMKADMKELIMEIKRTHFKVHIIISVLLYMFYAFFRKLLGRNSTYGKSKIEIETRVLDNYFNK